MWELAVFQQIKSTANPSGQTVWSSSGCNISMNSRRPGLGMRKTTGLSREERFAWVATIAHFGHLRTIASFFLFLGMSFLQKDYGDKRRRKALIQEGKKLHEIIICTAWNFLMFIVCAPQLKHL